MSRLKLNYSRVKAADETGKGWFGEIGSDDIYLAAVTVDGRGAVNIVDEVRVGEFDDGDARDFSPPKTLTSFRITGSTFPQPFVAAVVLAERDSGDQIPEFLAEVAKTIRDLVPRVVARKTQASAKDSKDSEEIIGIPREKLLQWSEQAVKAAWRKYKEIRKDDIFQPKVIYTDVTGPDHRWDGSRRSPQEKLRYAAHDGVYWVGMHWAMD